MLRSSVLSIGARLVAVAAGLALASCAAGTPGGPEPTTGEVWGAGSGEARPAAPAPAPTPAPAAAARKASEPAPFDPAVVFDASKELGRGPSGTDRTARAPDVAYVETPTDPGAGSQTWVIQRVESEGAGGSVAGSPAPPVEAPVERTAPRAVPAAPASMTAQARALLDRAGRQVALGQFGNGARSYAEALRHPPARAAAIDGLARALAGARTSAPHWVEEGEGATAVSELAGVVDAVPAGLPQLEESRLETAALLRSLSASVAATQTSGGDERRARRAERAQAEHEARAARAARVETDPLAGPDAERAARARAARSARAERRVEGEMRAAERAAAAEQAQLERARRAWEAEQRRLAREQAAEHARQTRAARAAAGR